MRSKWPDVFGNPKKVKNAIKKPKPSPPKQSQSELSNKVYLCCPYSDKDKCKALGGRWDPSKKKWYVPKGMDTKPFSEWLK